MNYEGEIIEESLRNPAIIKLLHITSARVEPVTAVHRTPWLKQWTLHTVSVPPAQAEALAEQLSHEIETSHQAWYIDFKNSTTHYIIFSDKVFKIDRRKAGQYQAATDYGLTLGIPPYQLDFAPNIVQWQRPAEK